MRVFFVRELRRQAPIAAGLLGLGALLFAAAPLAARSSFDQEAAAAGVLCILVVVAPLLLGVATVVPDIESGAAAFLARLPHSRRRELGARWAAAALLAAATIGAQYALERLVVASIPLSAYANHGIPLLAWAIPAFAAGVAASVAFHRSMTALVLAPALFAGPALAVSWFAGVLGAGDSLASAIGAAVVPFLAAGAVLAFLRGELHRRTWRPAWIVVASVLGGTLVVSGSAAAFDRAAASRTWDVWPCFTSPAHQIVVLQSWHVGGLGRGQRSGVIVADTSGSRADRELGTDTQPFALSPDGTKLLGIESGESGAARLELFDLATGRSEESAAPPSFDVSSPPSLVRRPSCWGMPTGLAWSHGEPLFPQGKKLRSFRGETRELPGTAVAAAGSRILCADGGGYVLWDVDRGERLPSGLEALRPGTTVRVADLSDDGEMVVALVSDAEPSRASLVLAPWRGPLREVPLGGPPEVLSSDHVTVFCARGRAIVDVSAPIDRDFAVDLATGAARELGYLSLRAVSPDGATAITSYGEVVDLRSGRRLDVRAYELVDDGHALVFRDDEHLDLLDVRTGAVRRFR